MKRGRRVQKHVIANYQSLDETLNGKKGFEHYDPDFFDLVIIDECHRSGFGDWFGILAILSICEICEHGRPDLSSSHSLDCAVFL